MKWEGPPKSLEEVTDGRAFACDIPKVRPRGSCYSCSKSWPVNDDGFENWRRFGENHWMVKAGIVRLGDRMNVVDVNQPDTRGSFGRSSRYSWAYDPLGWFARCVDKEACEKRHRNNVNHVHPEHLSLLDELDLICETTSAAKAVMA